MKMVKSLLLGSAAGLVAVAGAQAADLPVKAKPVEYVKVCSIYGAGFFYIPGTDTCIKIGGWIRAEYGFQTGNSEVPYNLGAAGRNNRINSNEINMRARWVTSLDVRTQTEYGTLRAYTRAGFQTTTGKSTQGRIYTERGFIQFAGFTFGKSQSYFDFFGGAFSYGISYMGAASATGAAGVLLAAYTATFGNGFTATLSIEDQTSRRGAVWDASNDATNALTIGAMPGPGSVAGLLQLPGGSTIGDYAAQGVPDIVGSLRVDQAWGSAQIAGALHQVRAGYYGNNTTGAGANVLGVNSAFLSPGDAWGWAAMAGIVINLPWAKGDKFYVEGTVSEGNGSYVGWSDSVGTTNKYVRFNGANVAAAWAINSIFGTLVSTGGATGQQLTRFWSINGALEHYWTPALRTSSLRQLHCRGLQRDGHHAVLLLTAEPGPPHCRSEHAAHRRDGCGGLRSGLQRLGSRHAYHLEPGAAVRYRPGSDVHAGRDEARSEPDGVQLRGWRRPCGRRVLPVERERLGVDPAPAA